MMVHCMYHYFLRKKITGSLLSEKRWCAIAGELMLRHGSKETSLTVILHDC